MKKKLLWLFVLFVAINVMAGPKIECELKTFDFGTMHDGQTAEHIYTITNGGDEPLLIGKIRACCGSTAVISSTTIKPGDTAELTAKLPLRNRSGGQDKNIFIASNDPSTPYLQLKFIGEVQRRVTIEPRSVRFMDLKVEQTAEQDVRISSTIPMNITKVESSNDCFTTEYTKKTKGSFSTENTEESSLHFFTTDQTDEKTSLIASKSTKDTKVSLTTENTENITTEYTKDTKKDAFLTASENTKEHKKEASVNLVNYVATIKGVPEKLKKGLNRGTVTLHTDNPDYPRIRIYCRAAVESAVKVTPSELKLKKSGKPVTRYVAVRADKPFKVQGIIVPFNEINVTYKPRGENAWLFIIKNIPSDEALNGKSIRIKTDYNNGREIEIPIEVAK